MLGRFPVGIPKVSTCKLLLLHKLLLLPYLEGASIEDLSGPSPNKKEKKTLMFGFIHLPLLQTLRIDSWMLLPLVVEVFHMVPQREITWVHLKRVLEVEFQLRYPVTLLWRTRNRCKLGISRPKQYRNKFNTFI